MTFKNIDPIKAQSSKTKMNLYLIVNFRFSRGGKETLVLSQGQDLSKDMDGTLPPISFYEITT